MVVPRVLPGSRERAEPFWQAAADGVLVVQRCGRCGQFAHPPRTVCVTCHAADDELAATPVSGRGTVASWVVVQRAFLEVHQVDVPYVVVAVALEEDPTVRMLGMLVDGPDAPVALGAPVQVVFLDPADDADGVRVPAFALGGLVSRFAGGGKVAVVGAAHSPIRRRGTASLGSTAVQTALAAIADAGLTVDQIDGFTTGSLLPTSGTQAIVDGETIVTSNWLAETLGLHPRFVSGFQGRGQLSGSVILAAQAVATGAADHVLVHRAMANPTGPYNDNPMTEAHGEDQWKAPFGFWGAPTGIAMLYNEYLQRFGADPDALANVVVEARRNGSRIPWSHWAGKPLSVEDYLASPPIAGPIRMHDCDIPVDGVGAFVLTSAARARDLPNKPVYVAGFAQGHLRQPGEVWQLDQVLDGGRETAAMLWESSGLRRDDLDVPQLYDGFAPLVYFWLEVLGYCGPGEAADFVQGGRISVDGPLPILSGGGALGNGRMHGVPQMMEVYRQLSGRAGERQLASATAGIACHAYPHFGGVVAYTSEPV